MRVFACIAAYLFGLGLALVAAFTGSVGPEGPRTELGNVLMIFYRPYYELLCVPFGGVGFLIALMLSGVPFALLVWLVFLIFCRIKRSGG